LKQQRIFADSLNGLDDEAAYVESLAPIVLLR